MKPFKTIISLLLTAVFIMSLLPMATLPKAAAADEDDVLNTFGHQDTDTYSIPAGEHDIYLSVPFSYPAADLNLSDGLAFFSDPATYYDVVVSAPTVSQIDGSYVVVRVTFSRYDDLPGAPRQQTDYHVYVARSAYIAPTFSGTLQKDVKALGSLNFMASDFTQFYARHDDQALKYISIKGSNPLFGTLQLNGVNYIFGTRIDISSIGALTFKTGNIAAVSDVSFEVTAYTDQDLTYTPIGKVIMKITAYPAPQIYEPLYLTVNRGFTIRFSPDDFLYDCDLYGVPLLSLTISPENTTYGIWYLGTTKITTTTIIDVSEINNLSFSANVLGIAPFSWSVTTMAGTSDAGIGAIYVRSPVLTLTPFSGSSIIKGSAAAISLSDFQYDLIDTELLRYIKITALPPATDGTLILSTALPKNDTLGYPAIAANGAVPLNAVIPAYYVNYLRLTTKSTCTKNQVSFMWTATADAKVTAATWGEPVSYTVPFMTTGLITYTTDMNIPVTFASNDFISVFPAATGYPISYVTFTLPDKASGSLYLNYNIATKTGAAVAAATKYYVGKTPNLSNITFVPAKDYTGYFDLVYTAYMDNGKFITGTIRINVSFNNGGTLSYVSDKNSALQLDAKDFQTAFFSATGKTLSRITFTLPSPNYGELVYNRMLSGDFDNAVSAGSYYYVYGSQYISLVTFMPHQNYTGRVEILYTAYPEDGSAARTGKLVIFVVDSPGGIVAYSVRENGMATISGADFTQELLSVTGSVLSYVTFTPPIAANGSLYFRYDADTQTGTKVASATKYYDAKSPDISDITYVPPKDFTGTITIPYKAVATSGVSYDGKLKFTVYAGSSVISYSTEAGKPQPMIWGDFASAFYMNSDGKSLSYVTFEPPSATYGRFYYNYTSPSKFDAVVSNDKKYYISTSPYLSNVSFVPQDNYAGTFYVNYTGYTSTGASFSGKIKITVRVVSSGSIKYETINTAPAVFKSSDFTTAFTGKSVYPLSYVRFTLPYESYGILYYNYNPLYSNNERVSSSANYSVSLLSYVSFVPNRDFSGVLAVSYTAYDTIGNAFTGTVLITVKSNELGTITYGTNMNKPVRFNADDFSTAFMTKTGAVLSHVSFTLPALTAGTLWLDFSTTSANKITAGTNYFRSYYPQLSNISFVPSYSYTGTVTIQYTAYPSSGTPYYGKININVGTAVPYTDMDAHVWAKEAVSYLYRNGVIADDGSGNYYPGVDITRADFVVMIINAFNISGGGSDSFPDVPEGSDYYDAVSAAKALGIVHGSNDGKFYPYLGLTRQDAMVIIKQALDAVGMPLTGSSGDLAGFPDASQVSSYAVESVAALVKTGFVIGASGKLNPKSTISRAEIAVILYKILTM